MRKQRAVITPGGIVKEQRDLGVKYSDLMKMIRYRFKKKIKVSTLQTWCCRQQKQLEEEVEETQREFVIEDKVELDEVSPEVFCEGEWNSYAGSMLLYAMLIRSGFLGPFSENIYEKNAKRSSSWSVQRVLLTLFFIHALRLKSIEQTKHLEVRDFSKLVGGDFLRGQWLRYGVDEVVGSQGFDKALDDHFRNQLSVIQREDRILYTDGHFSNYYGKQKVPKGYDPRRQRPSRGRNTIYLHNSIGENIYLFESPTNTTLSNDIEQLIQDIENLGEDLKGKTLCFDRGGFSSKCFKFLRSNKMYWITYMKHRKKEREVEEEKFKEHKVKKETGKEFVYRYYEKEARQTKHGKVRVIMLLGRNGKQIPIITTNPYLRASRIIEVIKGRWCEENGFKYMVEHFGIDLLTTYKSEEAPNKIIERPHPERKEINRLLNQKKRELEKLQSELAQKVMERGEKSQETIKEFYDKEHEINYAIKNVQVDIDYLKRKKETIPVKKKTSLKKDHVIMAQKRRQLINTVKAMNYNTEKYLQDLFKKYHDKKDETLSLVRRLFHQPGRIYEGSQKVRVELKPLDNGPMSDSLDQVLKYIGENNWLRLPDGRHLEICQTQ